MLPITVENLKNYIFSLRYQYNSKLDFWFSRDYRFNPISKITTTVVINPDRNNYSVEIEEYTQNRNKPLSNTQSSKIKLSKVDNGEFFDSLERMKREAQTLSENNNESYPY